ncbi:MAG TPA: PQQ-binding-like beta-propeller repeat protein [Candidatus Polarisedimenticolia bacterium]|jgi:outer membrane protein assembly factor BamB
MFIACALALSIAPAGLSHSDRGTRHREERLIEEAAPAPARPLSVSFEVPVEGTSAPMLTGLENAFAVSTPAGRVTAYGAGGGAPIWQTDLASPIAMPPLLAHGRLAVLSGTAESFEIVLLDPADGRPSARTPLGPAGTDLVASVLKAGLAVSGTLAGTPSILLADPNDGAVRWKVPLPSPPSVPAAQCGEMILVGTAEGALMSLTASSGALRWKKKIGGSITTPLLCNGKRGYVGSADNRLHAVRLGRGRCRSLWSYPTGGDLAGRLTLFGQRVFFFSYDTYLYGVEADNGHLAWKARLGRRPRQESLVLGSLLVVAQLNTDRLESFRLPEGTQASSLSLPAGKERFVTPPARAGRMVVIGAARYGEGSSRIIGIDLLGPPNPAAPSPPR